MNRAASLSRAVFFAFASLILTIIVCAALTFALFVNEVGENTVHVQAGDLEIAADYLTLTGTRMDTNSQSATYGKLIPIPQAETVKNILLTENEESIFLIENAVPTLKQTATIKLENKGNVAFDYEIRICDFEKLHDSAADVALSEQIQITISDTRNSVSFRLADYAENSSVFAPAEMLPGADPITVTITAEFLNDVGTNFNNMDAENGGVSFDITIIATQTID